jgi:SapC
MSTTAAPGGAEMPVFYKDPHVLEPGRHGAAGLGQPAGMGFAGSTNSIPLAADEFFAAQAHYPIVFTAGEAPSPVAVVGLVGDRNAFVDPAGNWRAGAYIPAYVRRYPFIFVHSGPGTERWLLAIDEAAEAFQAKGGHPFFAADGSPTEPTRQALAFCAAFQRQHEVGQAFAAALAKAELLVDYRAEFDSGRSRRTLSGFRIIDEQKFNALADEVFLDWRKRGFIALAYAQLTSMLRWPALGAMARGEANA